MVGKIFCFAVGTHFGEIVYEGGHQFKTEMLCKSFKCSLLFFITEWVVVLLQVVAEDISGSRGSH